MDEENGAPLIGENADTLSRIRNPGGMEEQEMPEKPTVSFTSSELPEINSWRVGGEYELALRVRMKEKSSEAEDEEGGEVENEAEFEVLEITPKPSSAREKKPEMPPKSEYEGGMEEEE